MNYYDREEPIDKETFSSRWLDMDYRRIGFERLENGIEISTVWLGMDHAWQDGPPVIFETIVFDKFTHSIDEERYTMEAEACQGHEFYVARWKDKSFVVKGDWN